MAHRFSKLVLRSSISALAGGMFTLGLSAAQAQEMVNMAPDPDAEYSPYVQHDFPNRVLFGDTHLHTGYSADAGLVGATTTPDDAYRFAKGETVTSSHGVRARLQRPLDFLVVADHAENLGLTFGLEEGNQALLDTEWGRGLAEVFAPKTGEAMAKAYVYWGETFGMAENPEDPLAGTGFNETMWQRMTEAAERHNDPGSFTTLIGYEWSTAPQGNNLRRNIIFRDGKDKADRSSVEFRDTPGTFRWLHDEPWRSNVKCLTSPRAVHISVVKKSAAAMTEA